MRDLELKRTHQAGLRLRLAGHASSAGDEAGQIKAAVPHGDARANMRHVNARDKSLA